jgi:hypothetical protein
VRSGKGLKLDEYFARWADPKVRLAGMDAAGQNAQKGVSAVALLHVLDRAGVFGALRAQGQRLRWPSTARQHPIA